MFIVHKNLDIIKVDIPHSSLKKKWKFFYKRGVDTIHFVFQGCLSTIFVQVTVFKSNPAQLQPLNQSNSNRKLIKTVKVWIILNFFFFFHKPHRLNWISDLIFKTDPFNLNRIILYNIIFLLLILYFYL